MIVTKKPIGTGNVTTVTVMTMEHGPFLKGGVLYPLHGPKIVPRVQLQSTSPKMCDADANEDRLRLLEHSPCS